MKQRRWKMRDVDYYREGEVFALTARRLLFPQRETLHLSYRMMRVHIRASHTGKLRWHFSFRRSEVSIKTLRDLFLGLKSVTVLQSSRLWKTVIHHRLCSLDIRLWPWAINSITDVLQQLRLNNYTEEERTFSARPGWLMDSYKYG